MHLIGHSTGGLLATMLVNIQKECTLTLLAVGVDVAADCKPYYAHLHHQLYPIVAKEFSLIWFTTYLAIRSNTSLKI